MIVISILIFILLAITAIASLLFCLPGRQKKIREIIRDLESNYHAARQEDKYAITENILFFKATKSFIGYIIWGCTRRKKIDAKRLLEIADLPLPRWERELYHDLTIVERRKFPGLTTPLRELLFDEITLTGKKVLIDFGCGSMEAERQVLNKLKRSSYEVITTFIGVDAAPQAWDSIKEVFSEFGDSVDIKRITKASDISRQPKKPIIYFYHGEAVQAAKLFTGYYDLAFSSRFKHHLGQQGKKELERLYDEIPYAIEYDDYNSAVSWLLPLLTAWNRPILLNGAVFSHIRQPSKKEVSHAKKHDKKVTTKIFSPPGTYAKIYSNDIELWGHE